MWRQAGGALAGILAGGLCVFVLETAGHALMPPPAGIDPASAQGAAAFIDAVGLRGQAMIVGIWAVGVAAATLVAGLVAGRQARWPGIAAAIVQTALGLVTMTMIAHPLWMWIATPVFSAAAWLAANRALAARR